MKITKTRETNVEFVTRIMEYSRHGAMAQLFVLDALDKWSHVIANMPDDEIDEEFENSFVNGQAWKAVAQEIQDALKDREERK